MDGCVLRSKQGLNPFGSSLYKPRRIPGFVRDVTADSPGMATMFC